MSFINAIEKGLKIRRGPDEMLILNIREGIPTRQKFYVVETTIPGKSLTQPYAYCRVQDDADLLVGLLNGAVDFAALAAENKRLREALDRLTDASKSAHTLIREQEDNMDDESADDVANFLHSAIQQASAAPAGA